MKISVIGAGYVGLAVTASLAELGHIVTCVDNDAEKIKLLRGGGIPIYEPLLQELVAQNLSKGTIEFGTELGQAIKRSEVIFIAVGTPSNEEGGADLSAIYSVARGIGQYLDSYRLIVNKSTGPVGTSNRIANIIFGELAERRLKDPGGSSALFDVVSNPEFLREGSATYDFLHPDRIIIGTDSQRAIDLMLKLYQPIIRKSFVIDPQSPRNNPPETMSVSPQTGGVVPTLITDARTAEMIKYASNAFLATKISFINEIGNICKYLGLDVYQIAKGIALDHRIAPHFLEAGLGFGGSCLPKDTRALISIAKALDYEPHLLNAILEVNRKQPSKMVALAKKKLGSLKGKRIGLLGLAFKKGTDDIRESVAIPLANELLREGAIVSAYDPKAMPNARKLLADRVLYESDAKGLVDNADCVFIITDWDEFKDKDLYKGKVVIDGRRVLAGDEREGIEYEGLCWGGNEQMEKRGRKISLIIPAYNEEERLGETLSDYISYFSNLSTDEFEIIVVCNGCDDNTPEIAAKYSQEFQQMIALNISDKIGKGGAIKEGFKIATGDIIGFVDADGAIKPDETWKLIQTVSQGYDGAIGSRWLPGSQVLVKKPFKWRVASRAWNLLVRLFFQLPFKDTQCGAKAFKRYVIQSVINDFQINGMTFDVGLLWRAKQRGYNIKEVPIIWEHKYKEGPTNNLYKTIIKMAIEIIKLKFKSQSEDEDGINV